MNFKLLVLISIGLAAATGVKNYQGYKVYNVLPKSENDVNVLKDAENIGIGEFWDSSFEVNRAVKIMVAPEKQKEFLYIFTIADIKVTEVIEDVQKAINDQLNPANVRSSDTLLSFSWDRYYNLDYYYAWFDELAEAFPNIVSTVVMGRSVENREIKGIIINFNPDRPNNLIGMIEGTLHAREWISGATVSFIIKEFLTSADPKIRAMAENFEWHIFPIVNPDGYVYTFTTNRMWRKNRSTANVKECAEGVDNDMSNGVDLNRNFDFMWMSIGASNDSCTNTYAGPSGNSEPETRAISEYVTSLKDKGDLMYYIAFHSYTQLIIIPYSHLSGGSAEGQPSNYADLYEIAMRSSDAIYRRFVTSFRVGVAAEVLYPMSGTSFDWAKNSADVPITYLFELRDLGDYGFLLPADQIVPSGEEIMDGLVEMDRTAIDLGYYQQLNGSASGVLCSVSMILLGTLIAMLHN